MITLFQFQTSPFTDKVTRVLNYKGLGFEVVEVNRQKVEDYKHVSPFGKFPAMEIDGSPICDSTDIAHALEEKYPEIPILPADPQQAAMVHIIEDWADESLYFYEITMRVSWENNAAGTMKKFLPTLPAGMSVEQAVQAFVPRAQELVTAQGLGRKRKEQVIEDARRHLQAVNRLLCGSEWLVGDSITLADMAVIAQMNCLLDASEIREMFKIFPDIAAWMVRVNETAPTGDQL